MSLTTLKNRTVIFFIAGQVATSDENAAIAGIIGNVLVRVANPPANTLYGVELEPCDLVAGTVPTAYAAKTVLDLKPGAKVFPATATIAALGTVQLSAWRGDLGTNGAGDIVAATGGTWASSVPAKATVHATTGLVTGVASGATVVTYTGPDGKTATSAITVS
jgi:hypothetical protein